MQMLLIFIFYNSLFSVGISRRSLIHSTFLLYLFVEDYNQRSKYNLSEYRKPIIYFKAYSNVYYFFLRMGRVFHSEHSHVYTDAVGTK